MSGRRDPLLIILYILRLLSSGPATITNIVYKTNLNHESAQRYISLLESKGCLQRVQSSDGRFYLVTQKGLSALKDLKKIVEEVWAPVGVSPWQRPLET